jgi:hypothetical protein
MFELQKIHSVLLYIKLRVVLYYGVQLKLCPLAQVAAAFDNALRSVYTSYNKANKQQASYTTTATLL